MILKNILKTKTVSVWGLGYLGYNTILKLQSRGFNVLVYNLNMKQVRMFLQRKYPGKEHIASWSSSNFLPDLDFDKIKIAKDPSI